MQIVIAIRSVHYQKCATNLTDNVCAKKDMPDPGVTNAYPVTTDIRTVNHVVVRNGEARLLFATHLENALVYRVSLGERANSVVQGTINIPNANVKILQKNY